MQGLVQALVVLGRKRAQLLAGNLQGMAGLQPAARGQVAVDDAAAGVDQQHAVIQLFEHKAHPVAAQRGGAPPLGGCHGAGAVIDDVGKARQHIHLPGGDCYGAQLIA